MDEEEREDLAEWRSHPHTIKMLKRYIERRSDQLARLVMAASASTDIRIVSIAAHFHALDLEVENHGGKRMTLGGKHGRGLLEENGGTEG